MDRVREERNEQRKRDNEEMRDSNEKGKKRFRRRVKKLTGELPEERVGKWIGVAGAGNKCGLTPEIIIKALMQTGGIIKHAADLLGVSHQTVYNYMKEDAQLYKDAREFIAHTMYDLANTGVKAHLENMNAKVCMWIKARYEARETIACFPEGDQSDYMNGVGGNMFVQNNINIYNNKFNVQINNLTDRAESLGVSPDRVQRIKRLQMQLAQSEGQREDNG